MLYQSYKNKIEKIAKIVDTIKKYEVLILSVIGALLAMLITFLSVKGITTEEFVLQTPEIIYGEELSYFSDALFSKTYYEFREGKSGEWQEGMPDKAGTYNVRSYSKKAFGIRNYSEEKKLVILPKSTEIKVKESSLTYGEKPTASVKLVNGDRLEKVDFDFEKTVGNLQMRAIKDSAVILNSVGEDVTDCYNLSAPIKKVFVRKKNLKITVPDKTKVYDGKEFKSLEYSVEGLAFEDKETFEFNQKLINVGRVKNQPNYTIERDGKDVSQNYVIETEIGYIEITKRKIELIVEGKEKVYDGTPLSSSLYTIKNLARTDTLEISFPKTITYVKDSCINTPIYSIKNANGEGVLFNYDITESIGRLAITKRDAELIVYGKEKVYDGISLSDGAYDFNGLAPTDALNITFNQSIEDVSEIKNTPTYSIIHTYNHDLVKDNYNITEKIGNLKITHRPITVTAKTKEKVYDNSILKCNEYEVDALTPIAPNQRIYSVNITGEILDVGSVENKLLAVVIYNAYNRDVTKNYSVTKKDGTLKVTKRNISIGDIVKQKIYDDTAFSLNSAALSIGGLGLANGQEISILSKSANAGFYERDDIEYKICNQNSSTNQINNYDISFGKVELTIDKRDLTITANSDSRTYNSLPLKNSGFTYDNLVYGHQISVVIEGSATNVLEGEKVNQIISYTITRRGENVAPNYNVTLENGTLKILPCPLYVIAYATKVYDDEMVDNEDILVECVRVESYQRGLFGTEILVVGAYVYANGVGYVDAGEYTGALSIYAPSVSVLNGQIENYAITYFAGDVIIEKRPIKISTNSVTEKFARQTISDETINLLSGTLCANHQITDKVAPVLKVVGSLENKVTFSIKEGSVDKTKNYNIESAYGTLTLNKRVIVVWMYDYKKVYDGNSHAFNSINYQVYNAKSDSMLEGDSFNGLTDFVATDVGSGLVYTQPIVNAGHYKVTATSNITYKESYSGYYDVQFIYGDFVIEKSKIIITTLDIIKTEPITTADTSTSYRIADGNFALVDTLSVYVNGYLNTVGSAKNRISSIKINSQTVAINGDGIYEFSNYTVEVKEGTLTYKTPETE